MGLNKALKMKMVEADMTVKSLSEKTGIPLSVLSKKINGRTKKGFTLKEALVITRELPNITLIELTGDETDGEI